MKRRRIDQPPRGVTRNPPRAGTLLPPTAIWRGQGISMKIARSVITGPFSRGDYTGDNPPLARMRGFTLIELVVVIIILSILAAVALPRFFALQTQARVAKLNGTLGSVKGAAVMAHAGCLGSQPQCTAFLPMEGVNVTMINHYPTADAAGIITAVGISVGPASPDGYDVSGGGPAAGEILKIKVLGNDPENCSFTYTAPGVGQAPIFSAPVTTGC